MLAIEQSFEFHVTTVAPREILTVGFAQCIETRIAVFVTNLAIGIPVTPV
jgi:hypothetical protein